MNLLLLLQSPLQVQSSIESYVYINMLHTYALINQQMALSFFIGTLVLFRLLACKLQFIFSVLGMQNEKN